ncbi:MAG: hypothetical protein R2877_06540 [Bdellovibrionota bacterium]
MAMDQKDQPQEIVKKADQLRLSGSYAEARALLEALIKQNPFFAPAKLSLGRAYILKVAIWPPPRPCLKNFRCPGQCVGQQNPG